MRASKLCGFLSALALLVPFADAARAQQAAAPKTVFVPSGALELHALLWRPTGPGPFPAVLFNHGSGHRFDATASDPDEHPMQWQAEILGPVFVRHGYVFLFPLRRGTGLSADQGVNSSDLWQAALAREGPDARNRLQVQLLETVELDDVLASLAFLRALPGVDKRRIAVAGHSFGGALTLLMAERDGAMRAAVVFASAARSWPVSPPLRARLITAVEHATAPVFILFAANDYSVEPAHVLGSEMDRLGKPHRVKIYPAVGTTAQEGHSFVHLRVAEWEPDVFSFLDPLMK